MSTYLESAVLIGRYRDEADWLVFIRRAEHLRSHPGELAFPGGRYEPANDRDLEATALREAHEEIGLDPADVQIVRELPEITARYGNECITPYVANIPADYAFSMNQEVSAILHLNEEHLRAQHPSRHDDFTYFTEYGDVWGLTGRIVDAYLDS